MYIVDYSLDYNQRHVETKTFNDKSFIIDFIADKSSSTDFRLKRINKYEGGRLFPHHISLSHGRITIESQLNQHHWRNRNES